VHLQRKVAGIEKADFGFRNVALERFRARRQDKGIVAAPYRQQGPTIFAEISLERGIERALSCERRTRDFST